MLAFYPEFEAAIDPSPEVIFLVDLSNSMKGDPFRDARKVCSLKKSLSFIGFILLDMLSRHNYYVYIQNYK